MPSGHLIEPGGQERCNQSLHLVYSHMHTHSHHSKRLHTHIKAQCGVFEHVDASILLRTEVFCLGDDTGVSWEMLSSGGKPPRS